MVSEQLLSYIKENLQAGFSRHDIEATLHTAGWTDADVAATFEMIKQAKTLTGAAQTPAVSHAQSIADAEVARIQEELRVANANKHTPGTTDETGIVGFIIKTNMATTKQGAQILLGVLGVVVLALLYMLFLR